MKAATTRHPPEARDLSLSPRKQRLVSPWKASAKARDIEGLWDRAGSAGDVVHLIVPYPGPDSSVGLLKRDFGEFILNNGKVEVKNGRGSRKIGGNLTAGLGTLNLSPRSREFCRMLLEGYKIDGQNSMGTDGEVSKTYLPLLQTFLKHHVDQLPFDGMVVEERREQVREYLVNALTERIELKRQICHGYAVLGGSQYGDETTLRHVNLRFEPTDPPLRVEVDVKSFLEDLGLGVQNLENPQEAGLRDEAIETCDQDVSPQAATEGEATGGLESLLPLQDLMHMDFSDPSMLSTYAGAVPGRSSSSMVLPHGPAEMPGSILKRAPSMELDHDREALRPRRTERPILISTVHSDSSALPASETVPTQRPLFHGRAARDVDSSTGVINFARALGRNDEVPPPRGSHCLRRNGYDKVRPGGTALSLARRLSPYPQNIAETSALSPATEDMKESGEEPSEDAP